MKATVKREIRMTAREIDTTQLADLWRTLSETLGETVRTYGQLTRRCGKEHQKYEVDTPEELEALQMNPGKGEVKLGFLNARTGEEEFGISTREGMFLPAAATDLVVDVQAPSSERARAMIEEARRWESENLAGRAWTRGRRGTVNAAVSITIGTVAAATAGNGHYSEIAKIIMAVVNSVLVYGMLNWIQQSLPARFPGATGLRVSPKWTRAREGNVAEERIEDSQ